MIIMKRKIEREREREIISTKTMSRVAKESKIVEFAKPKKV